MQVVTSEQRLPAHEAGLSLLFCVTSRVFQDVRSHAHHTPRAVPGDMSTTPKLRAVRLARQGLEALIRLQRSWSAQGGT
jgi:hypothetical protein